MTSQVREEMSARDAEIVIFDVAKTGILRAPAPDTLAMWDNRSTRYYAANDYLPHRRVTHRATLKGSRRLNCARPISAAYM